MIQNWPFGDLMPGRYGAILCDPPWEHVMRSEAGHGKSPSAHYDTMTAEDLRALPVSQLAGPHCLLFMWTTWPHLTQATALMKTWGFTYKTGGSWTKTTASGKRAFGTGYVLRSTTEPFLLGTIGAPKYRSRSIRNLIESERREHSRKPPEARQMIDALLPDVWGCELFAREPWPGRDVWGNQTATFA